MMSIAVGADSGEAGGVMGLEEFKAVDIGGHYDVIPIRMLIDLNASMISGNDHVA